MNKMFSTIVRNSATVTEKRGLGKITMQFINMDSRGTAVAIGPLEYCGCGITLVPTRGKTV